MDEKIFNNIVGQILDERMCQDGKWGNEHDDRHTMNDWAVFINRHVAKAVPMRYDGDVYEMEFHRNLVKAGAIIFAALEAQERNLMMPPRHYDGEE